MLSRAAVSSDSVRGPTTLATSASAAVFGSPRDSPFTFSATACTYAAALSSGWSVEGS